MQAVESQTLILYHSDLRGQWPQAQARALAATLPYAKRLEVASHAARAPATLAGIALALRALGELAGREIRATQLAFPQDGKPRLLSAGVSRLGGAERDGPDFSISHSGPWVGCAAVAHGLVGFDLELGTDERLTEWAAREAALKACGAGLAQARAVALHESGATCRGTVLNARALGLFPGAAACVMTSRAVDRIQARAVPLAELFAS
jgi:4'-phosphopantetheinyl transferase